MTKPEHSFILTVVCPDTVGVVAEVSSYMRDKNLFIEESSHYGDPGTGIFFMRTRFNPVDQGFSRNLFAEGFRSIAEKFSIDWHLHDTQVLPRVLIMVSRLDHCLNDLLYRYRTGSLPMHVPAIVSNHMDLAGLAKWHNIPYFHVPISKAGKPEAEGRLKEIIEDTKSDTIVLARYMQVFSDKLCRELAGKVINIHHSFLPGFKGAKPYHRAHERGVKLIGATAHFVTSDLDEGPIIEQSVERVDHTQSTDDLVAVGRDVEAITLARALKYHLEHRVFMNGSRTVVFR